METQNETFELSKKDQNILQAGTGFMPSISEAITAFQKKGYTENLTPKKDHFESRSGEIRILPSEFHVDTMERFENTSDPNDQSALYAISVPSKNLKGLYVESYGIDQDPLSKEMIDRLRNHL